MKPTLRQRLYYRFERFLSKGGTSIFLSLLAVFTGLFLVILGLRYLILLIWPELSGFPEFADDVWITFLQMTDPGNMYQDTASPTWLKITTILSGIAGVIILSMLIAFITTALEKMLYEFRKGRGKVLESEHTLILGWNDRVVDIIRELIIANESEKYASVVILANRDKEEMDDMIAKRLPNTETTSVITTTGDYANINELQRVNIQNAKSVILLAQCSESESLDEKVSSDVQAIKSIMAMIACQGGTNELPIIAEIFSDEKRELISFFNDDNIIAIDSWDIMGKLLVQTSLTSGLEMVYNEMLSFDGCEVYFAEGAWEGTLWGQIAYHFKDGIPLGYYNEDDGLVLRPDPERKMLAEDQVIILAEDDSTINFETSAFVQPKTLELSDKRLEQASKRILILGWHDVARIFIREANDYLADGSVIDLVFNNPDELLEKNVEELRNEFPGFTIRLIDANPLRLENLSELNPYSYENVIILSQDMDEHSADKIDSDTLIILLLMRNLRQGGEDTHIITQVLNSENQEIITQTDVDDFIISNKLITMILAQLSEEPMIKLLYDDLFSEEGSEIYVKPANLYFTSFPQKVSFADIMGIANLREEICLGIRKGDLSKDSSANFGVRLNLPKDETVTIEEHDFLVVLSEDEL